MAKILDEKFVEAEKIIRETGPPVEELKEILREIRQIATEENHQDILRVLRRVSSL